MESYLCVLSSRFWAAHVLELFLVPAESILEASWLGQNWFAHQILVSLLVTWSTAARLRCPGVFLITLPNLWLPSWLPHAIFLVSTHLPGLWLVWHLTPTWILQLTWLRHSLAVNPWHLCFTFLTKLPYLCLCLSPWPTSELTSSPTPSALPHFSQGLPLPCHILFGAPGTGHCLTHSLYFYGHEIICFSSYTIRADLRQVPFLHPQHLALCLELNVSICTFVDESF